jgi:hypothetical protein
MSNYTIVSADLARDRDRILDVWERNVKGNRSYHADRFDWYYHKNPYGPGRCWLLVTQPEGRAVGTAGLGLRRIRLGNATALAGVAVDLAVDPDHRSLQPALLLQKAVLGALKEDEDLDFIYGLPNDRAVGIFRRIGYHEIGRMERHAKVLRIEPYLEKVPLPVPVQSARLLAAPMDWAMRAVSAETWKLSRGLEVVELSTFDERFDDLWKRASAGSVVGGVRSTEFLRWRYNDCPVLKYVTLGLVRESDNRLLGYAVYYEEDGHVVCADLLADDAGQTLDLLLAGLIRHARQLGAASISMSCDVPEHEEEKLRRFGFVARQAEDSARSVLVSLNPGSSLQPQPELMKQWRFLPGDEAYN